MIEVYYKYRDYFWEWCKVHDIECHHQGSVNQKDIWLIENEKDRMLAILRWT